MFAKITFTSLAAVAALGFAATTHAAPSVDGTSDPLSVKVSYADLNLSTPVGAQSVLNRIHAAAQTACGGETDIRLLDRLAAYHSCMQATVDRAVASLANPVVTGLYAGEPGAVVVANRR